MKKITIFFVMLFIILNARAQMTPQYNTSRARIPEATAPLSNYYIDGLNLNFVSLLYDVSDIDYLDMLYKRYLIYETSLLWYRTILNDTIPFLRDYNSDDIKNDFGARLEDNDKGDEFCKLSFDSKITSIGVQIFNGDVTAIYLPRTKNLTYHSSPNMSVQHLTKIVGEDVIEDKEYSTYSLVSKDSTLIAVAAAHSVAYRVPSCVTAIGAGALRYCPVDMIYLSDNVISIDASAFEGLKPTCKIYVEKKYKSRIKKMIPKLKKQIEVLE